MGRWGKKIVIAAAGGATLLMSVAGAASASGGDASRVQERVNCQTLLEEAQYTAIDTSMCNRPQPVWITASAGNGWTVSNPQDFSYWHPANSAFYPYGYTKTIVSSANLAAPTYVVVQAAADVLGTDARIVYGRLEAGESLDAIASDFYDGDDFKADIQAQIEVRILEALANGTMQEWQAATVRTYAAGYWFTEKTDLLTLLNELS